MKTSKHLAVGLLWTWAVMNLGAAPGAAATAAKAPAWPQAGSDLKPDAAAVFGELPNGFRYVILPNTEPPGRLSLRMAVDAGSAMETDQQLGLAHFLEHMAFNGSKHFASGELVTYFQRMGMGFGGDTNAHTSYKETVYQLDLPETGDKVLKDSLQLMRDYADGLLIAPVEVDRERGVILSEKRDRDSVGYRTLVAGWNFYFPDSILSKRHPIGEEAQIKGANHDLLADFYTKWYTPNRLTLIAVGDMKPEALVPLIKEYFGTIAANPGLADPDLGKFATPGFKAGFHREAEAPSVTVDMMSISSFARGQDRAERRANQLRLDAAEFMVSRRLERISRKPDSAISKGDAYDFTFLEAFDASGIEVTCQPDKWEAALNILEQELRKALEYGFTPAEVTEAKANLLNGYEQASRSAATRKTRDMANALTESVTDHDVFTHPTDDLARVKPILESLTAEQCQAILKDAWGKSGRRLFVSGNLELPDAEATLTAAYNKSASAAVEKPANQGAQTFEYTSTGEPGKVVERKEDAELGIVQLRFANNVRVNLKRTDFEADKVRVLVQAGGGKLTLPANQPGLALVAAAVFTEGGLGQHSIEDIQQLLAGKTVNAGFSVGAGFFNLAGLTNPRDLRLELELLKAYVTDPGYRPESLDRAKREFPEFFNDLRQNVEAVLENEVARFVAGGDARFGFPTQAQAEGVTMENVRAWLAPALKDGYLEISLVGDFDPATTEKELAATFGALPVRAEKRADYAPLLTVKFPTGEEGVEKTWKVPTVIPKAIGVSYWPTTDMQDIERARQLNVLAEIFSDRLRVQVREKLGEAYSPYAQNNSNEVYPKFGFTFSLISSDPALAPALVDKMRELGAELAAGGITQDEFDRAVTPLKKSLVEYRRQNAYWLGRVLAGSQAFPQQLQWAKSLPTAYDRMTLAQVQAVAKDYLGANRAVRVLVIPEAPAGAAPTPAGARGAVGK